MRPLAEQHREIWGSPSSINAASNTLRNTVTRTLMNRDLVKTVPHRRRCSRMSRLLFVGTPHQRAQYLTGQPASAWREADADLFLWSCMCLWLVWLSLRGLRIARGVVAVNGPRLKMWRIFAGVFFLLSLARSVLDPASNRYQADNLAQAIGMYFAPVIMFGLAIWLIRSAFPRRQRTGSPAT